MTSPLPALEARVRLHHDDAAPDDTGIRLLAFAELTVAGAFVIKSIRILQGDEDGPFIVFPAEKAGDRFYDVAHPTTAEARAAAVDAILGAYAYETAKAAGVRMVPR
ncbi:MAG: septation protein SpoVG family protein [bacterium]